MPVEKGQRLKLLKIWEILRQETDEAHPMSSVALLQRLEEIDIKCDRRTLYADIQALNESGYKIHCNRRKTNEYFVERREFSMAEIQILMDAVQAASFITKEKTEHLVDKIAELAGSRKAEAIKRNVVAFNTVKSPNEDIFGTVAIITQALECGKKIEYQYFDYDLDKHRVFRKGDKIYKVNPVATIFSDDKYYLLCYDDKHGILAHYRIDRMANVKVSSEDIMPSELSEDYAIQKHKRQLFGMFKGEECDVTFEADNSLIDTVLDKFGFDTHLSAIGEHTFRFTATVQISPVFLGWCCSFGEKLKVVGPERVGVQLIEFIVKAIEQYNCQKKHLDLQ